MNIIVNPKSEKENILYSINKILNSNSLLSLATLRKDSSPSICSVYYACDSEFNLYFWSDKKSQHSINIIKNKKVSVSILDTNQKWGTKLKGLKIYGKAKETSMSELMSGGLEYMKKFIDVENIIKDVKDFNQKYNSKLYKIAIDKIILLDELTFGKENYKEVEIAR